MVPFPLVSGNTTWLGMYADFDGAGVAGMSIFGAAGVGAGADFGFEVVAPCAEKMAAAAVATDGVPLDAVRSAGGEPLLLA